ncbi:Rhodanese-like domain-containing protein [Lineolata rhizophorae]|uniref:Rhodanese-like domain-containing protein n=1 Tax=Lineolata rhizophorae TaxID=578093 RepID=A0A6A6P8D0_9PEZI|nr:Rhodanese-like domain-containing protein [Lineolata rhizophorae]
MSAASTETSGLPPEPAPWHAAFPAPQSEVSRIERSAILEGLVANDPHMLLVDVRRTDFEAGTIKGSINMPAQSFWWCREGLYRLCRQAGITRVIFYCGSSNGRGPRCAGWFADYIRESGLGEPEPQSLILEGGIKGWAKAGGDYVENMQAYEEAYWK